MEQVKMSVGRPTYDKLARIKAAAQRERGRQVTFAEVLDDLVRHWEATEQLVRDAQEAGR